MRDLEVIFEQIEVSPEESRMRLNKAFEILFSEIVKDDEFKKLNLDHQIFKEGGNLNGQTYI